MPSIGVPVVMANWPLEWKLGCEVLAGVVEILSQAGLEVWDSGQALLPHPFGSGRLSCKVEAWQPGLVFKFQDALPPALLLWRDWQIVKGLKQPLEALLDLLLAASHPARFSPYACLGPAQGLFAGREKELALLLSPAPALVIAGESGMGKTSLFMRASHRGGGRFICCQDYTLAELRRLIGGQAGEGHRGEILFLDEMDGLFRDHRTFGLLRSLNRQGTAWRAAVHKPVKGIGPNLLLPPPRGLANLLLPIEEISGHRLGANSKALLLACAAGNPRRLQYLAGKVLELMDQDSREVSEKLIRLAVRQAFTGGEGPVRAAGR